MIQQFQKWNTNLTGSYTHMRSLLTKNKNFIWSTEMETKFVNLKEALCSPSFIKPYDTALERKLFMDTSKIQRVGFCLVQETKEI